MKQQPPNFIHVLKAVREDKLHYLKKIPIEHWKLFNKVKYEKGVIGNWKDRLFYEAVSNWYLNMDIVKFIQSIPVGSKYIPRSTAFYVFINFKEKDEVYQYVIHNIDPSSDFWNIENVISHYNNPYNRNDVTDNDLIIDNLSVEILQRGARAGMKFKQMPIWAWWHNLLHDFGGYYYRRQVYGLYHPQLEENLRVVKYLLIHVGISETLALRVLKFSLEDRLYDFVELLIPHVNPRELDALARDEKHVRDILITKAKRKIARFVRAAVKSGGSIDKLLYRPPNGLMIKRSMRTLNLQ